MVDLNETVGGSYENYIGCDESFSYEWLCRIYSNALC